MTEQSHSFDGNEALATMLAAMLDTKGDANGLQQMLTGMTGNAMQADVLSMLIKAGETAEDFDDRLIEDADYRDLDDLGDTDPWLSEDAFDDASQEELEALRQANDTLADALGACAICWGGDNACHHCRGRGRPGARRPDPALFTQLVMPAVRAMRRAPGPPFAAAQGINQKETENDGSLPGRT